MPNLPPRLQRLTHSLPHGKAIIAFLREPTQVAAMISAAEKSLPSVVGISHALLDRFGPEIKTTIYKQYTGMAIRWVIEQHGFQVLDQGVKISNDPVYASGTRYARQATTTAALPRQAATKQADIIERLVSVLSTDELRHLIQAAQARLSGMQ